MSTILVSDDDADIRDLVAYRLERDGHTVTTVSDGMAALDHLASAAVDVVILDVMTPGMSGIDAARAIRADRRHAKTPIILLTARTQESDVAQGYAVGVDDYVAKPFSPRELSLRVGAVLARRA
jgi:two-component system, OmpR family, response regulator MtrA